MPVHLKIEVPGTPKGKASVRTTRRGFAYTPAKTVNYMSDIKAFAMEAIKKDPVLFDLLPTDLPIQMTIDAYFPIPNSYSKKKRDMAINGSLPYVKKPDTDNISKLKDALSSIVYNDDRQVVQEIVTKMYSEYPRLVLNIFILDEN